MTHSPQDIEKKHDCHWKPEHSEADCPEMDFVTNSTQKKWPNTECCARCMSSHAHNFKEIVEGKAKCLCECHTTQEKTEAWEATFDKEWNGEVWLCSTDCDDEYCHGRDKRNEIIDFIRSTREAARRDIIEKYSELLHAVGNKHEGETRHQTALRYIRDAEKGGEPQASQLPNSNT